MRASKKNPGLIFLVFCHPYFSGLDSDRTWPKPKQKFVPVSASETEKPESAEISEISFSDRFLLLYEKLGNFFLARTNFFWLGSILPQSSIKRKLSSDVNDQFHANIIGSLSCTVSPTIRNRRRLIRRHLERSTAKLIDLLTLYRLSVSSRLVGVESDKTD